LTVIQSITKARPRRGPNRVQLVEPDGTPVRPSAESWPAWTDSHRWVPTDRVVGTDSMAADVHESDCVPEPDESDEEWLARLEEQDEAEKARVLATYYPLPEDVAEYVRWCAARDNGTLPAGVADRFRFGILDDQVEHYRPGQPTEDELSQLAAHGCI
jgi:hypothetical protein